jgi:hypothetical protein
MPFQARMRAASGRDWMIIGGGLAAFVLSLFPFVGVSAPGISVSHDAWISYSTLGVLLILAAAAAWALTILQIAAVPRLPVPLPQAVAIGAGVGTALILLRGLTYSSSLEVVGVSVGIRFGGVLLVVAGAVVTAGAILTGRSGVSRP